MQPCFFYALACVRKPHTDPTGFAGLMLNLTDALRTFASSGSHRSHRSH